MKRSILLLFVVFGLTAGWAQAPYQFNFQAVARNLAGNPMTNTAVDFRLSILQGDPEGTVVYVETQTTQTNNFGLANLLVGSGVADLGSLANLDWMAGPYFLRIELADNDGNYLLVGSSPLMSVPYALHAKTSEQAGPQGIQGETGLTGPQGEQGPQGIQGETGPAGPQGEQGPQGIPGEQGETGPAGAQGETGPQGEPGANGLSAYEVWLGLGNSGTVADYLNSLKGETGAQGAAGAPGQDGVGIFTTITNDDGSFTLVFTDGSSYTTPSLIGPQGEQGEQGPQGEAGPMGPAGATGASAYETWLSLGNSGSEDDFIASLTGPQGVQGTEGLSAYEVWLSQGNEGSEEEFLISLQGSGSSEGVLADFAVPGSWPNNWQPIGESYSLQAGKTYALTLDPPSVGGSPSCDPFGYYKCRIVGFEGWHRAQVYSPPSPGWYQTIDFGDIRVRGISGSGSYYFIILIPDSDCVINVERKKDSCMPNPLSGSLKLALFSL